MYQAILVILQPRVLLEIGATTGSSATAIEADHCTNYMAATGARADASKRTAQTTGHMLAGSSHMHHLHTMALQPDARCKLAALPVQAADYGSHTGSTCLALGSEAHGVSHIRTCMHTSCHTAKLHT